MANTQRKQTDSVGQPTISIRAERSAESLSAERTALRRRRMLIIGVPGMALVLLVSGLFYACGSQPSSSSSSTAEASTTAAPAVQATAVPAAQSLATAAPAAASTQPANGAQTGGGITCPAIAGLPIYANATCIKHDTDQDDGVIKNKNTYVTTAATEDVRRFFEGAFTQNGWTVAESKQHTEDSSWEYTITQAQRRLKVEVEAEQEAGSIATQFTVKELSPNQVANATPEPANSATACTVIAGLPSYANATCIKHDSDQDDGVIKNENTYVTNAAVDEVRRFFEGAFAQNGWAITESKHDTEDNSWSYSVTQAQRRLKVEIEPAQGANGTVTRMTIAEK
jgi:hypothetical protein